ncbi:hypothetical protein ACFPRL_09400 [Pseudoclavibacter helvolus]
MGEHGTSRESPSLSRAKLPHTAHPRGGAPLFSWRNRVDPTKRRRPDGIREHR